MFTGIQGRTSRREHENKLARLHSDNHATHDERIPLSDPPFFDFLRRPVVVLVLTPEVRLLDIP